MMMNYHDQKIRRTPTHDIREHWTAVSTLLGLISSVYRNLHHWRSNQRPQIAVPKLYNRATSSYRTQMTPNQLVMVIVPVYCAKVFADFLVMVIQFTILIPLLEKIKKNMYALYFVMKSLHTKKRKKEANKQNLFYFVWVSRYRSNQKHFFMQKGKGVGTLNSQFRKCSFEHQEPWWSGKVRST